MNPPDRPEFSTAIDPPAVHVVASLGALFVAIISGTVFIGWILDDFALKALIAPGVTMKTNTSIGLFLLSFSLLFQAPAYPTTRAIGLGRILAGGSFLIGFLTMSEHIFGWNLGIDELLRSEPPGELYTSEPNRMGPPASICLMLGGIALMLISTSRRRLTSSAWPALLLLSVALLPTVGYIYGAKNLYGVAKVTGIALHTALCLIILAVSILIARPRHYPVSVIFSNDAGGMLARYLVPVSIVMPIFYGWLRTLGEQAGWYDASFGRSLLVLSVVFTFTGLVWFIAARLGGEARARSKAEALSDQHANMIDTLLAHAPLGFAFVDREGKFLRLNDEFAQINDLTVEQHLGRTVAKISIEKELLQSRIAEVFEAAQSISRIEIVRKSKALVDDDRTWLLGFYPVLRDEQAIVMAGIFAIDISDRKRIEQQRARLLEQERAARTQAENIARLKDDFLGTLSHELRTPLNAIVGWASLLQQGQEPLGDRSREGLAVIERNARTQARLIEDLLDVSRIISGKFKLENEPVVVAKLVEHVLASAAPLASPKHLSITSDISDRHVIINGDQSRLQQILTNLMSNAIKFTPEGGSIHVVMQKSDNHVEISVKDSGQGIKQEFLPYIFDRFRQADSSRTRRHGGLGLGLSIARQLAQMHGGTVEASSDGEGQGATFTVRVPIRMFHSESDIPTVKQTSQSEIPSDALQGLFVLVVDDEGDSREVVARLLTMYGAKVISVGGVDDALIICQDNPPDVLVSDIAMPHRDGYDLISSIRKSGISPQKLPAIALSALVRPEDQARALREGFQTCCEKPVDPSILVSAIRALGN